MEKRLSYYLASQTTNLGKLSISSQYNPRIRLQESNFFPTFKIWFHSCYSSPWWNWDHTWPFEEMSDKKQYLSSICLYFGVKLCCFLRIYWASSDGRHAHLKLKLVFFLGNVGEKMTVISYTSRWNKVQNPLVPLFWQWYHTSPSRGQCYWMQK